VEAIDLGIEGMRCGGCVKGATRVLAGFGAP
jgi:copper chaperone CopZ